MEPGEERDPKARWSAGDRGEKKLVQAGGADEESGRRVGVIGS